MYVLILTACGNLERLEQGKQLDARVITSGLCRNVVVESILVDMYGKCGRVGDSQRVFDRKRERNAVSWCAWLNGYCQNGLFESDDRLFIRACASLAVVRLRKKVHCQYVRGHVIFESDLIDLYAKCGCINYAHRLFMQMPIRNLITWNSMICGFAQNGSGLEAIGLFNKMIKVGVRPDYISFLGVTFAFSHASFVDKGREYFISNMELRLDLSIVIAWLIF